MTAIPHHCKPVNVLERGAPLGCRKERTLHAAHSRVPAGPGPFFEEVGYSSQAGRLLGFTPEMVSRLTAQTPPSAQAGAWEMQAPFLLRRPHYSWPRLCAPGLVLYATQQSSDRMRKRGFCDGVAPTRSGT